MKYSQQMKLFTCNEVTTEDIQLFITRKSCRWKQMHDGHLIVMAYLCTISTGWSW